MNIILEIIKNVFCLFIVFGCPLLIALAICKFFDFIDNFQKEKQMEKLTQAKINSLMAYAENLGISVLQIGVSKKVYDEYNKIFQKPQAVVQNTLSAGSAIYQRGFNNKGCVQIVALEDEES